MKNFNEMNIDSLIDELEQIEVKSLTMNDENEKAKMRDEYEEIVDCIRGRRDLLSKLTYDLIENEIQKVSASGNRDEFDKLVGMYNEKKYCDEHEEYINKLVGEEEIENNAIVVAGNSQISNIEDSQEVIDSDEYYDEDEYERKPRRRAFKAVLVGAALVATAVIASQCAKKDAKKEAISTPVPTIESEVETTEEPEENDEIENNEENDIPEDTNENDEINETDEQSEIEAAASSYYEENKEALNKNADGKSISEQDIINIAYLINDKEELLSVEDFNDACDNIENGCGYEPSMLLSITSSLENKDIIKETLNKKQYRVWEDNFNKQVDNFVPAKLSELVVKNDDKKERLQKIEKAVDMILDSVRENGEISSSARKHYNNMLVDIHYNNAYNNDSSISDDTENNDNLGFKYLMNAATYAAYDLGTTINPNKETIKSTKLVDPITGKAFSVKLTTHNNGELDTINRIAQGENSHKLVAKYTKIKNELPVLGYKDDMCADRQNLEKQVKHNAKVLTK